MLFTNYLYDKDLILYNYAKRTLDLLQKNVYTNIQCTQFPNL